MAKPTRIHTDKHPPRIHYIPEWAKHRRVTQAEISRALGVDKSSVSRWFAGALPVEQHLLALAGFLEAEEPAALFRHPDDDWLAQFFRRQTTKEKQRLIRMLRAMDEAA